MPVEAQYPSHALFLKKAQDPHDMFFNNTNINTNTINNNNNPGTATNSRKRARETVYSPHLTQLHHHQQPHSLLSTGLRLSFPHHQHQQQQQHEYNNNSNNNSVFLSLLSQGLASQVKQQLHELDLFLQAQGEELRRELRDRRQRHSRALLRAAEETVQGRLREKEAEVEKATRRNAELEARAAQLSVEAQVWQAKAKAQEATAASLEAQLRNIAMVSGGGGGGGGEEGLSCAAEDAESAHVDPHREREIESEKAYWGPKCRGCGKEVASIVLLPCRHLCICSHCNAFFRTCPVCLTVKNSTVLVHLS